MTMHALQAIDERIAQLQARRAAMLARERDRARKRDTRRKILLGSGLVALVREGDTEAEQVYRRIRAGLDERSAKALDGWEPAGGAP